MTAKKAGIATDLSEMTGDPFGPPMSELTDRPDPMDVNEGLRRLREAIDNMPAGTAHGLTEPPEGWSAEFNGPHRGVMHGLNHEQREAIYNQLAPSVTNISNSEIQAIKKTEQDSRQLEADLWREYQVMYPELSQDPEGTKRALETVKRELVEDGGSVAGAVHRDRQEFIDRVARQQTYQSYDDYPSYSGSGTHDYGRTGGLDAGNSNAGGGRKTDEGPGDMMAELRERQKRSGFF